jgi:hypothetical protein
MTKLIEIAAVTIGIIVVLTAVLFVWTLFTTVEFH